MASFANVVGGENQNYSEMMEEARKIAISRMVDDAKSKGANAIVGMRLQSVAIAQGAAEMVAYGTAVVIQE